MGSFRQRTLIFFAILIAWGTGLTGSALQAGETPMPVVQLMKITPPGAKYSYHIAKIESSTAVDPAGNELASRLLKNATNFIVDEFEETYPEIPKEFFEKMRSQGIQIEGSSSMIVIFRDDDPERILATMRFAYADPEGKVPLE